jgi:hypothetical protein
MAFVRAELTGDTLVVADADGGNQRDVIVRRRPSYLISRSLGANPFVGPAWSPDGSTIAVFESNPEIGEIRVVFVDADTGSEIGALDSGGTRLPDGLIWLDSTTLLMSQPSDETAALQLWRLSYPDGAVSRVTTDLSNYRGVSLDDARRQLVTTRWDVRAALWVGHVDGSTGREIIPLTSVAGIRDPLVAWAGPDVVFETSVTGRRNMMRIGPEGGRPTDLGIEGVLPVGTSDGRTIVFEKNADLSLWRIDADGRNQRRLMPGASFAVIAPDDRDVIFLSDRSGLQTPWRMSIEGPGADEPVEIVHMLAGAGSVDVSPDRRLLFASNEGLVICDLPECAHREGPFRLTGLPAPRRWMPDGDGIAFVCPQRRNICSISLDDLRDGLLDRAQPLTQFPESSERRIASFAFSHDGARLAIILTTLPTTDIVLLRAR